MPVLIYGISDFEALSRVVNVFYSGNSKCVYINEDNFFYKKEDFVQFVSYKSDKDHTRKSQIA